MEKQMRMDTGDPSTLTPLYRALLAYDSVATDPRTHLPDATAPDPVAALYARTQRTLERDLRELGITGGSATMLVDRVLAALKRVFVADGADLPLADRTAACLVAERTMIATVAGVAADLRRGMRADAAPPAEPNGGDAGSGVD